MGWYDYDILDEKSLLTRFLVYSLLSFFLFFLRSVFSFGFFRVAYGRHVFLVDGFILLVLLRYIWSVLCHMLFYI